MEDKKYFISSGMNLGNSETLMDSIDRTQTYYRGNLTNILESDKVKYAVLRTTNFRQVLDKNPEYIKWLDSEEALEGGADVYMKRQIEFLGGQFDDIIKAKVDECKKRYSGMFEKLERIYQKVSDVGEAEPIEISDGYANFADRKLLLHNVPFTTDMEAYQSRKDLGLLASEWFGVLEKFTECEFCVSTTKTKGLEPKPQTKTEKHFTFIIDAESSSLKKLLHLDYFQYVRKKEKGDLSSYTTEEIEFLDQLSEWNFTKESDDTILTNINKSRNSKQVALDHTDWSAIPAGIPSKYIIGIIANGIELGTEDEKIATRLGKMFNVPVLTSDLEVIYGETITSNC